VIFFSLVCLSFGAQRHFSLYKKVGNTPGNHLLVIGGIHGNEPGAYFAPSILVTHYKILKGSLWIVPNLNFDSDVTNSRGLYGDMNRKFAYIKKNDKDFRIVRDIKKIITNPKVDLVLNLHDGHGFYREAWENNTFNPQAWGQACIIDQNSIKSKKFGDLKEIANRVAKRQNSHLVKKFHLFNVKNTKTKLRDKQMRLSLTYFAINHLKPAFAIETSKNIKFLYQKVFYQLRAIEGFMKEMGIKYTRDFKLSPQSIKKIIADFGKATINNNAIINLNHVKRTLKYFPLKRKKNQVKGKDPLLALVKRRGHFDIMVGNILLSSLSPDYKKQERCLATLPMRIDGRKYNAKIASIVDVKDVFSTRANSKYRINVIGFSKPNIHNENAINIRKKDIIKHYAMDTKNSEFRIEIYKKKSYCGMVVVRFTK
jgi:hypothetical protein